MRSRQSHTGRADKETFGEKVTSRRNPVRGDTEHAFIAELAALIKDQHKLHTRIMRARTVAIHHSGSVREEIRNHYPDVPYECVRDSNGIMKAVSVPKVERILKGTLPDENEIEQIGYDYGIAGKAHEEFVERGRSYIEHCQQRSKQQLAQKSPRPPIKNELQKLLFNILDKRSFDPATKAFFIEEAPEDSVPAQLGHLCNHPSLPHKADILFYGTPPTSAHHTAVLSYQNRLDAILNLLKATREERLSAGIEFAEVVADLGPAPAYKYKPNRGDGGFTQGR